MTIQIYLLSIFCFTFPKCLKKLPPKKHFAYYSTHVVRNTKTLSSRHFYITYTPNKSVYKSRINYKTKVFCSYYVDSWHHHVKVCKKKKTSDVNFFTSSSPNAFNKTIFASAYFLFCIPRISQKLPEITLFIAQHLAVGKELHSWKQNHCWRDVFIILTYPITFSRTPRSCHAPQLKMSHGKILV